MDEEVLKLDSFECTMPQKKNLVLIGARIFVMRPKGARMRQDSSVRG